MASIKALIPLFTHNRWLTFKIFFKFSSNSKTYFPRLVIHRFSHKGFNRLTYLSKSGKKVFVTFIILIINFNYQFLSTLTEDNTNNLWYLNLTTFVAQSLFFYRNHKA